MTQRLALGLDWWMEKIITNKISLVVGGTQIHALSDGMFIAASPLNLCVTVLATFTKQITKYSTLHVLNKTCWTNQTSWHMLDHTQWTTHARPHMLNQICWTTCAGPNMLNWAWRQWNLNIKQKGNRPFDFKASTCHELWRLGYFTAKIC